MFFPSASYARTVLKKGITVSKKHIKILTNKLSSGYYHVIVESSDFQTVYLVEDSWRPEAPERGSPSERWGVWEWDPNGWPELDGAPTVEDLKKDPHNGVYQEITTQPSKKECMNHIAVWAFAEQIGT